MNMIGISNLLDFTKFLKGQEIDSNLVESAIVYFKDMNMFIVDTSKIPFYKKAPSLTTPRFIEDMKLLETMAGVYVPIVDKETHQLLFTKEEFLEYRKKMSGLKEYGTGDYIFSDNLYFEDLDPYLEMIDANIEQVNAQQKPVVQEFIRVMESIGLSVTIGCNSGGDVELVEAGSTSRYTNIPDFSGKSKWDFDFTVRIDSDKVWMIKQALETKLKAGGHITRTAALKVRLTDVEIPGLDKPIDLDFSLTPQKERYLPTEDAISHRLENMKEQDEYKYRLVLANIMYAKAMLKKAGSYKAARSILDGPRENGGLGGVGIENWVLQYGGSLMAAAEDFVKHAEGKDFMDFEKEYAIMDFGQNHVSTTKRQFPYDNFVMKNMRYRGFEIMRDTLIAFLERRKKDDLVRKFGV